MNLDVLVFTDRRIEYLEKSLPSLVANLDVSLFDRVIKWVHLDLPVNGDWQEVIERTKALCDQYRFNLYISHNQLGCFGSVQNAWARLVSDDADYVFHAENDFLYLQPVPVSDMLKVMEGNNICQVVLKRQAWYQVEAAKGGFIETRPRDYNQEIVNGILVNTHIIYFGHNPSLYKKECVRYNKHYNELSHGRVLANLGKKFAIFGSRQDKPRVWHFGKDKQ